MESVLQIYELADLIIQSTRPKDAVKLASTSRLFFHLAAPIIWRHVDDMSRLFKLVSGMTAYTFQDEGYFPVIHINLPKILSEQDFARFNVYAPWVRSLKILGSERALYYVIADVPSLLSYTKQNSLLPNLEKLALAPEQGRDPSLVSWIHALIPHSLLEVQLFPSVTNAMHTINLPYTCELLNGIFQRCPQVRTLGIFAVRNNHSSENQTYELVARTLTSARSLTHISGDTTLLDKDILITLGHLPLLSRLAISDSQSEWAVDRETPLRVSLLDTAFPVLKHLELHNALKGNINRILGVPTLLVRLTSLDISFRARTGEWGIDEFIQTSVPQLCQNSPNLTRLALDFGIEKHKRYPSEKCELSEYVFRHLERLPLVELVVSRANLTTEVRVERLAVAWPNMEVLKWTERHVRIRDISLFARHMPRLRYLAFEVDMMPPLDEVDVSSAIMFSCGSLRTLEGGFFQLQGYTSEAGLQFRRYISVLYPNARLETWDSGGRDSVKNRKNAFLLGFLNKFNATPHHEQFNEEGTALMFKMQWEIAGMFF
ncbi:hypothetical protein BDV93DRAFT_549170 [Ceratobasidium sp. AG-I]|nr:hypothetical protein BDV93DRAFT_549170 [Ceratobasidium sp. AG-I]